MTTLTPLCQPCAEAVAIVEGESLLLDAPHDNEPDEAYDTAIRHCINALSAHCRAQGHAKREAEGVGLIREARRAWVTDQPRLLCGLIDRLADYIERATGGRYDA
jgi:hypothetical protein